MRLNKFAVVTFNVFLLSPFASIPLLILQLKKRVDTGIVVVISLLIGFLSANFIPFYSNDKTRYIERYDFFNNYTFSDLINYFKYASRPDYLFDTVNFLFSKMGVDYKYFFFTITFVSVFLTITAIKLILKHLLSKPIALNHSILLLILSSLSLVNVLSGLRFFLGGSFFLWFLYYFYFRNNYKLSLLFILLAFLTHFSYSLPLLVTIASSFLRLNSNAIKLLLLFSLSFLLLTPDNITNVFELLSLPSQYTNKAEAYLNWDIESSENLVILNHIRNLWFYFAFLYLLFSKPYNRYNFFILAALFVTAINFFYPLPVVFNRYITFFKVVFAVYLIFLREEGMIRSKTFHFFLAFFILGFLVDILVLRQNFEASYHLDNMWTIYHIFEADSTSPVYIYPR